MKMRMVEMGDVFLDVVDDDDGTMKAVVLNCIDVVKLSIKMMEKMMTVVLRVSRMKCNKR